MSACEGALSLRAREWAACAQSGRHAFAMKEMEPTMLRNFVGSGLESARSRSRRGDSGRGVVMTFSGMECRFMRRSI